MNLTSTNNEKVKFWEKLKIKKYRDKEKLFLIEDEHLVNIALEKNIVKEILVLEEKKYNVPTFIVNEKIMKQLTSQVTTPKVVAVCHMLNEQNPEGNIILLDNIQDPGNLGTIIRSASAFNFNTIILSNNSVDLYNSKVIRATEGMIFNVNVIRTDLEKFIIEYKNNFTFITTDVNDGEDIREMSHKNVALVIGNEGNGVRKEIADLCSKKINIKMNKNCESLNAGVCASILMYEVNYE